MLANDHCLGTVQMAPPNRRPSADPPTTPSSTAAAASALARSNSSRRRHRRHSCNNGTDDHQQGSSETISVSDQREEEGSIPCAKLSSIHTPTILCLREAMRELARPQMHLCIGSGGAPSAAPASTSSNWTNSSNSTLSVAISAGLGCHHQQQQQRRSSGGAGKRSSVSPPSREAAMAQQQQQMPTTLLTTTAAALGAVGGGTPGITTAQRSASVCYPPAGAPQPISRRCSTTTKSGGRLERSNSLIAGRGGATLAFLPELNPQQVANLRRTWKHINTKGLYDIIRRSFRKVESAHSSVALAFRQSGTSSSVLAASAQQAVTDGTKSAAGAENSAGGDGGTAANKVPPQTKFCGVMEHSKYFMVLLNRIIDGDNNQEELERELKQIGARHVTVYRRFGVGVTEIERTGEALAESLFKLDGIRQSKETTKVWRVLIAKIIDHIESGFTDELRSQRRRTSSALLSSAAGALAAPLFESKSVKRSSVPNRHNTDRSASNEEDANNNGDDGPSSPTTSASLHTTAVPSSLLSPAYHQQQMPSPSPSHSSVTGSGGFLRAELAGVVRRLSNL